MKIKNKNRSAWKPGTAAAMAACVAGWLCWNTPNVCRAQSAPVNLSPQVQEIVRLNQAHLGDDVIKAYIKNSGRAYSLSADDILYLSSQGISQGVLSALLQAGPPVVNNPPPAAPAPQPGVTPLPAPGIVSGTPPIAAPSTAPYAPPSPPPAGSDVNFAFFQSQLAPYGAWVDIAPYGLCWRPAEAQRIADWRPYCNMGHWEYTDAGWFWHSDYPWGEIAFHYGRWARDPGFGWVWVPGYNWGPAWVCWRQSEGFFGWAPLPPFARFEVGVGLTFGGRVVTDFDFGLPAEAFVFVPCDRFWDRDLRAFVAPRWRAPALFRASIVLNGYHFVDGRFVVDGIGRDRVAALTRREIRAHATVFRDGRIAHEAETQRAHAIEVQRGIRTNPGGGRPGEERRPEERRDGNR
jgi:hypothetical protein